MSARACGLCFQRSAGISREFQSRSALISILNVLSKNLETRRKGVSGEIKDRNSRKRRHRKSFTAKGAKDATAGKDKSVISFAVFAFFAVNSFSDSGDDGDLAKFPSASRLRFLLLAPAACARAGTRSHRGWSGNQSAASSAGQCRCPRRPSAAGRKKARGYSLRPWRGLLRRRALFLLAAAQSGGAALPDRLVR